MASGVDVGGVTFMGPWQRAFLYGLGYLPYWCSTMALAWGCSNTFGSGASELAPTHLDL